MDINRKALSWESLTFRKRKVGALTRTTSHKIRAFDTETYKGAARLICDSDGRHVLEPDIEAALSFLTGSEYRQAHTFAYNLRFDAQAILKMLPRKQLKEISERGATKYKEYKIKYIPKKMLTLTDDNKHVSRIYDIAQFFETSLNAAAKMYLNDEKIDFPYRETMNTDIKIWRDYETEIIKYCEQDAALTARLGQFLDDKVFSLANIRPQSYISKASISKQLVRERCFIPDRMKIPEGAQIHAFYSYKGGRFECLKKGYFPDSELYDIVSAYADEVAKLIDPTRGHWKQTTSLHDEAYYGFYICHVYVKPAYLCPLAYVMPQAHLIYPYGEFYTYLTKQEIEAYYKDADIEIISGWEYYPDDIKYPFGEYMADLFRKKKTIAKDDYKYDLVKKMMNSVYGSTYEKIKIGDNIVAGMLFNPIFAAVITANVRIKTYRFAKAYERDIIALATDSVLFKGKHSIKTGKELGDWDLDGQGAAVVLMSGIYEMGGKAKTRGIMKKQGISGKKKLETPFKDGQGNNISYDGIFDYIRSKPELKDYPYITERPLQMGEALKSREKFTIDDINIWQKFEKSVKIDGDIKRFYDQHFNNGGEIFLKSIDSEPLLIEQVL